MTRALWIREGRVANVIEYPGEVPAHDEGFDVVLARGAESVGDAYAVPVNVVTRRQMLIALHRTGMLDAIKAAVAASTDVELQLSFAEAAEFERSNAALRAVAAALGKTDAEIDAVFSLAAKV